MTSGVGGAGQIFRSRPVGIFELETPDLVMLDFSQFYQNGGVLMHAITLCAVIGFTAVLLHGRARRMGDDDPKRIRLADRMGGLCVALGVLGLACGLVEMFYALSTIGTDKVLGAALRGGAIVPITLEWSLICAIPLWITTTVYRSLRPVVARRSSS